MDIIHCDNCGVRIPSDETAANKYKRGDAKDFETQPIYNNRRKSKKWENGVVFESAAVFPMKTALNFEYRRLDLNQ
jgi:hypothetical protein